MQCPAFILEPPVPLIEREQTLSRRRHRIASLNQCEYCPRCASLSRRGARCPACSICQPRQLSDRSFSEKEIIGFRYASLPRASGHAINKAACDSVRTHFSKEEISEFTTVAAALELFSRINSSPRVPVTPLPDGI